jgi:hypothetical protein
MLEVKSIKGLVFESVDGCRNDGVNVDVARKVI